MCCSGPTGASVAKPTLLILGASGFLGRNLLQAAEGENVVAVSREPAKYTGLGGARWIDLEDWIPVLEQLCSRGPVSVIHTIALTDHGYCERHPEEALTVNGREVAGAARLCRSLEAPFFFVCTDGLFPNRELGRAPHYWSLADAPEPVSAYGRSKLAGERAMGELGWGHSIRMSFVGPSLGTGRGLLAFLAQRLREGDEVPGFTDTWFTPAPAQAAAARLLALAWEGEGGHSLRHWGSAPAMTKFDYLERVAKAAGFVPRMLARCRGELPDAATVPLDQSLACENPWSREELITFGAHALQQELGLIR